MLSNICRKFGVVLLCFCLLLNSCKKSSGVATDNATVFQKYFETSILNQNFIVNLATENGVDNTPKYSGFTFKMLKTTYYNGDVEVHNGTNTYTGTWSSNEDYSKLTIQLPTLPNEFVFISRDWKFTSKNPPQLKLAPWGTTEDKVLWMLRQ